MGLSKNSNAFKFQRLLMICTGLWPERNPSKIYRLYSRTQYGLLVTVCILLLISTICLKDFSQLIHGWSMFVALINCALKFGFFNYKVSVFLDLLDFLHSPHFYYHNEEFDHYLKKTIKFSTVIVKLFFCSAITTSLCIISSPLTQIQKTRTTPVPFLINWNEQPIILYVFVYACQAVTVFSGAWNSAGFDNLSTSMMGLCSAYFLILQETIVETTKIIKETKHKNTTLQKNKILDAYVYARLSECAEHHLAVINFAEKLEDIFSYVFLTQFLCSAAGICLAGFTFINTEPGSSAFILSLSLLGTLMFQICLYCFFGNEITIQSGMVRDACYMTDWDYCSPVVQKNVMLIMERSKRPMVLTAGKFLNLSLSSLVAVVKSSVSYAMVLYQLYNG